jgi:hypothetical protein
VTAKSGPRRADERNTAAAGAPSGEDQPEPSSRQLVVLDALPAGELVDLLGGADGDAGKQRGGRLVLRRRTERVGQRLRWRNRRRAERVGRRRRVRWRKNWEFFRESKRQG